MKYSQKIIFIIYLITFVSGQNLFPILGGQRVGTSVFSFLNIGVSARAIGMGESVVALNQLWSLKFSGPRRFSMIILRLQDASRVVIIWV